MVSASAEDRALFRDSARGFLADNATGADVRRWMASDLGYDPEIWGRVAGELGWPALPVDEEHGGLGLGLSETALLMEEMGAALFCSPFFATVCLALPAIRLAGSAAQKAEYLPAIAAGELTATLALTEKTGRSMPIHPGRGQARRRWLYRLNGAKRFVVDGHSADLLIVAARAGLPRRRRRQPVRRIPAMPRVFRGRRCRPWTRPAARRM